MSPALAIGDEISDIVERIAAAHDRLLQFPGGIEIRFTLKTVTRKDVRNLRPTGITGVMRCRWPVLYVRTEGDLPMVSQTGIVIRKDHVRSASYDFDKGTSLAHDGNLLAQRCNYRHAFTAKLALPIDMQHFIEAYQMYDANTEQKTDFWLPNALNSRAYHVVASTQVDGVPCQLIATTDDKLSIAISHGYVVLRREFRRRELNRLEVFRARHLREVATGLWIPFEQSRAIYQLGPDGDVVGDPLTTETLVVQSVTIGDVKDDELEVHLPADIQEMEDHVEGINLSRQNANEVSIALQELQRNDRDHQRMRWIRSSLLGVLALLIFGGTIVVWRRRSNVVLL